MSHKKTLSSLILWFRVPDLGLGAYIGLLRVSSFKFPGLKPFGVQVSVMGMLRLSLTSLFAQVSAAGFGSRASGCRGSYKNDNTNNNKNKNNNKTNKKKK